MDDWLTCFAKWCRSNPTMLDDPALVHRVFNAYRTLEERVEEEEGVQEVRVLRQGRGVPPLVWERHGADLGVVLR